MRSCCNIHVQIVFPCVLLGTASVCVEAHQPASADDESSTQVVAETQLFNGTDLSGWTTWLVDEKRDDPRGVFRVHDGLLHISGDGFGYLVTKKAYRDYRLVAEYKWGDKNWQHRQGKARDSGIFVHVGGPDGNSYDAQGAYKAGIECQIMEGATGDLMLIRGRGDDGRDIPLRATARVGDKPDDDEWPYWSPDGKPRTLKLWGRVNWREKDPTWKDEFGYRGQNDVTAKPGQWTRLECRCTGSRIQVFVNDKQVNEMFDVFPSGGQILIQCEGSEIDFRRIELRPLGK